MPQANVHIPGPAEKARFVKLYLIARFLSCGLYHLGSIFEKSFAVVSMGRLHPASLLTSSSLVYIQYSYIR